MTQVKTSAIGIMSGTSLDGLDLCYSSFEFDEKWSFEIVKTQFVPYDLNWKNSLSDAYESSSEELESLDKEFGKFTASCVTSFIREFHLEKPDLICSHGHTVSHDPEKGITRQIGDGKIIANETGITCISDFRSEDISLGGQGAPLVPIGDELLFSSYDACLNLGGFSNISFRKNDERRAFDICPVNIVINPLSRSLGLAFDRDGEIARGGSVNENLLNQLNNLSIYSASSRPSLAREWVEKEFLPLLEKSNATPQDKIATVTEHAAHQMATVINQKANGGRVLLTGGGTKNIFLTERIQSLCRADIVIPDGTTIDFKEALIFAFLGVLKQHNQTNVLRSVTGARRDSSSGVINYPT